MSGTDAHGIVFDLDGVLMDSEHWWDEIRRGVAAEHGGAWRPESTTAMLGMSTPEWSGYLVHELGVRLTPEQAAETVIGQMAARFAGRPPVIAGAVDVVRDAARRAPTAIATPAPPRIVRAFLVRAALAAGMTVVATPHPVFPPDQRVLADAAAVIDGVAQLGPVLDRLTASW